MITAAKTPGQALYQQDVQYSTEEVWGLLREFTTWGTWSPFYLNMTEYPVQDPKNPAPIDPKQPIRRQYKALFDDVKAPLIIEEVVLLDDVHHILKYKQVQGSDPRIGSMETIISITNGSDGNTCKLTWESFTKPSEEEAKKLILEQLQSGWKKFMNEQVPNANAINPLDAFVAGLQLIYKYSIFGLGFHLLLNHFKEGAFELFNTKLLVLGGQAIVGNVNPNGPYQYSQYSVETDNMPKKVAGIPLGEVLPPKKFALILKRLLEMSYITVSTWMGGGFNGKVNYELAAKSLVQLYGTAQDIKLTDMLIDRWDTDVEFCQQYLQGVNPMMIARVRDFSVVPQTMRNLTVLENGKEVPVQTIFDSNRLFIVDYKELSTLEPINKDMYFYAPYVLLYREILANGESRLNLVGIQLERTTDAIVYTPRKTPKHLWTLAKMFVQSADSQVHEFRYHLGQGHLSQEPIVIATHNQLPVTHVIRTLLQPHLDETIGINFLARETLIAPQFAFTNKTFVVGTANGVKLASQAWINYDFKGSSFEGQLFARGFDRQKSDGLTNYWYRDDGFELWDCIGRYASNVVNSTYKYDKAVENDPAIKAWVEEMIDPKRAAVKGFPTSIKTRKELAEVCQIIIWNGSALHSVVNYPQWPYLGFIKNRPNGLYIPMPKTENGADILPSKIDEALLPTFQALFQLLFSWLLSSQAEDTTLPHLKSMSAKVSEEFQADLKRMGDSIKARNAQLEKEGKMPYVYCLPENIACSVNI